MELTKRCCSNCCHWDHTFSTKHEDVLMAVCVNSEVLNNRLSMSYLATKGSHTCSKWKHVDKAVYNPATDRME